MSEASTDEPKPREYAVVLLRDGRPVWPEAPVTVRAPPRRWPVLGVAALLFAVVTVWVAGRHAQPDELAAAPPPAPVVAALQMTAALPVATESVQVQRPAIAASAPEESIEICGLGRSTREQFEKEAKAVEASQQALRQRGLVTALAQMRQSDEPRTRAAALLTTAFLSAEDESKIACAPEPCANGPAEAAAAREALFELAARSTDPAVVQFAMWACNPGDSKPGVSCARSWIEWWVALEPQNAIGWMHLAASAQERKDSQALAAALQGIAQATVVDARFGVLAHEVSRHAAARPLDAMAVAAYAIGIEAATVWPIQPVIKQCEAAALNDGARRNDCERIAMLLTEHSRQPLDFSMGISIGKRLGWSADRIERLDVQREALWRAAAVPLREADGMLVDPSDITSCRGIERQRAWVRDLAEIGEIAALRKRIAASGYTEAELAAQAREANRKNREAAASQPAAVANTVAVR